MVNSVVTIQIQLNAREELSEFAIFFPAELFSVSLQESLELLGSAHTHTWVLKLAWEILTALLDH